MEDRHNKALAACWRFEGELQDFLEGAERPFIMSHQQDCPSCRALLADLQSVSQAARDLPAEEPGPRVWQNVHTQLQAEGVFRTSTCLRFEDELEAYLGGEARPFVVSHSRDCASCGVLLADLQSIREAAKSLPDVEPSRVVWANVRAALQAEGAFGEPVSVWRQLLTWRLLPQAVPLGILIALVLVGSVLSLPSGNLQHWGDMEQAASSLATTRGAPAPSAGDDSVLAHLDSELESNFRANEASMAPDLKATYEKSLVSLDGSIEECLDSLRHEPRNALAHDYLVTAYTRKAEVLSSALEFDGR